MTSKTGSRKFIGKVLAVVLCVALLGTTYTGFFRGLNASASAVDLDALQDGEVGVNKSVSQWRNSDGTLGRGADITVNTKAINAADAAVYRDIIPSYAEVVAGSIVASVGTAKVLTNQNVKIDGQITKRDIVEWTIGSIPSTVSTLKYSINVKDAKAYGILDVSEQSALRYTEKANTKTKSPLVLQIDELLIAPKGINDYYVVDQQATLTGNVKTNDDTVNTLIDRSGNKNDADRTVEGYIAGLNGNVEDAHLSPYTVQLVGQAQKGTVTLREDGKFTYNMNPEVYGTEVASLSPDANGTDAYNAVAAGWEDSFTYKLHTTGYSTKYIYETITHTYYEEETVQEGMSFTDINQVAGDKFCMLIFEDVNQTGADSEGRVIIGGNLIINGGWAVSNLTDWGDQYALLVGGQIIGNYNLRSGKVAQGEQWVRDYVARAREAFTQLSNEYAKMPQDGSADRDPYYRPSVVITPANNHQRGTAHVVYIDGNEYIQQVTFKGDFGDDQIIINISGKNHEISGGQWAMFQNCNLDESKLCDKATWNFYEATKISTSGFSFKGSVLAPYADYTGSNGHIEGTLIAKSATGTGGFEYHAKHFFFDTTGKVKVITHEYTEEEIIEKKIPISLTQYGQETVGLDGEKELESQIVTVYIRVAPKYGEISAVKTSDPLPGTTVKSGDTIEYTINVSNPSSVALSDVVISDMQPAGTTVLADTISDGGSADANGKVTWNVTIPANGTKSVTFKVKVNDNVTGTNNISNVAIINYTIPGSPETTTSTNTVNHAYLSATKSSSAQGRILKVGEEFTYSITIINRGSAAATDVVVTDTIPEGLTFVGSNDFVNNGGKLTANIPAIGAGETKTVSFNVSVDAFETGVRTFKNTAAVNDIPTNTTTDTSKRGNVVVYYREVGTEKELHDSTGSEGSFGDSYGPYAPVDIQDYRYVSVVGSPSGTYTDGTITIIFYYEKIPATAVVKYVDESYNEIDTPITYNGYVGETLEDLYGKKDTIGNYTYIRTEAPTYTLTEEGIVIIHVYKLNVDESVPTVLKSSDPVNGSLVKVGDYITYTISVTNNKYEAMNNVVVSDDVPKGATVVAADNAVLNGSNLQWTIDSIAAGETVKVNFTVVVEKLAASGNLSNIAHVIYTDRDSDTPKDIPTNVVNHAVLTAEKYTGSNERGYYGVGDTITYFIKVKNVGSADAKGIKVTDSVPAGTTLATGNTSWTIDLVAGAEKVVSFAVTINDIDAYNAVINNTAYVNDTPTNETEDIVKKGYVIVKYQDEEGNPLHEDTNYVGTPGDEHGDTSYIIIPQYTYKTTQGTTDGKFIEGTITIIHIYKRTPADAIVKYLEDGSGAQLDAPKTVTGLCGDAIESDYYHDITNYEHTRSVVPELIFKEETTEIIHYYRFIEPDHTNPTLVKESDPASGTAVKSGQTVVYTLTFTNTRIDTINNVVISDVLPMGSTLIEGSITNDGYLQNRTVVWNIGTMQPGEIVKVNFAVKVNDNLTASGNMANTAITNFCDRDGNPEEPITSNTTKHPIIQAVKTSSASQPDAILTEGDSITYTITVVNVGSDNAKSVVVEDVIPEGLTFKSSSDFILDGNKAVATLEDLVPGNPVELSFSVTIDKFADGVYSKNFVNAAVVNGTPTNEVEDNAQIGYVVVRHWDYNGNRNEKPTLLDQFTENKSGRVGTSYGTYNDLVSTKKLENRYFVTDSGNTSGNFIPGTVYVDFYYDKIPVTLTVKYLEKDTNVPVKGTENYDGFFMGEAIPSQYTEKVEVNGYNYDSVTYPENMIFDEENEVIIHYYVRILDTDKPTVVKSSVPANGSLVNEGNTITYSIKVTNTRNTDALEETVITDPIPAGTTFISADNEGALNEEGTAVVWNVGKIAAGSSKTVSFKVKVNTGITSGINLENQAHVSYRDVQINQTNTVDSNFINHALVYSVKTSSNPAEKVLYKDESIKYTVTAKNVGSAATDITIVDKVPDNTILYADTLTEGATLLGNVITYKVANVQPGATVTLQFTVKVNMGSEYVVYIKNKATVNDIPTNETNDVAKRGTIHTRYFLVDDDEIQKTEVTDYDKGIGYWNEGEVGTPLDLREPATIKDYYLFKITKNSDSEVYIPGDIEICYYFKRIPTHVEIHYWDENSGAEIDNPLYFGYEGQETLYAGDVFPSIYKHDILHYNYVRNDAPTKTIINDEGKQVQVPDLLLTQDTLVINHYYNYVVDDTAIVRLKESDPVSGTTVKPGQIINYTITVENPRYDTINNVVVTDDIPKGTTLVGNTISGNGTAANGTITWNIGTMNAKESIQLGFAVKVDNDFAEPDNIANKAIINYSNSLGEPQTPVNTNTVNHAVLKFHKEVSAEKANVGDELTYTIKVANYGSAIAEAVVIKDVVPEGTTLVPGSISNNGKLEADGTVVWNAGQIPTGGDEIPFSFKVTIDAPAPGIYNEKIVNTATVNDDTTNEVTTVVTLGTVTVTHIDDQGNVLIPKETHTGNVGDAFGFQPFDDTVIYGYNHIKTTVDGKEINTPEANGNLIEGNIDVVFVYTKGEGVLTVRYLEIDTLETLHPAYTEVFEIGTKVTDLHEVDLLPYYELVEEATEYNPADLVITREGVEIIYYYKDIPDTTEILRTKTSDPEPKTILWPGDEVTYTVEIENPRREKIDNIVVSDEIPAGTQLVEGSVTNDGEVLDGIIYWNVATLAIGEKKSFSFTVKVNEAFEQAGNVENTAHVTFTNRKDSEPVTYDTNTVQHPVLIAKKSVDKTEVNVGDEFVYTIEVTNYGSVDAMNVVITDNLPEGVSLVPENKPAYTFEDKVLTWNITKLEVGQTETFTFIVKAHTLPTGIYRDIIPNTAKVNDKDTNTVETTVVCGIVTITHVDEEGNVLIEKDITVDKVGTPYKFEKQNIEGYEYKETQGEAEGEIVEGETDVIMVYKKGNGTLTVRYLDEDTKETIHDSYTETMQIGDKVKDEHKEDIENYTYTKTDKPDDLVMTKDGIEIIHYYKHTPPTYTVEGKAWSTEESNSKYDKTDTPYGNLPVVLKDSDGKIVSTATTDKNGDFKFEDVLAGNYKVEYSVPTGYEVSPPLAYNPNTLNSCVTKEGTTPVTVEDDVKNIGMELYKTKVLGATDEAPVVNPEPIQTYTNKVETVKVYQPVEPTAEKVNYTRVLGDSDTPHTGDDSYGATIAMLLASASLFVLILCRKNK